MSGNGINWAICKSASRSRQITTPAPHHSIFTGRMLFLTPNQQCQSTHVSMTYKLSSLRWLSRLSVTKTIQWSRHGLTVLKGNVCTKLLVNTENVPSVRKRTSIFSAGVKTLWLVAKHIGQQWWLDCAVTVEYLEYRPAVTITITNQTFLPQMNISTMYSLRWTFEMMNTTEELLHILCPHIIFFHKWVNN